LGSLPQSEGNQSKARAIKAKPEQPKQSHKDVAKENSSNSKKFQLPLHANLTDAGHSSQTMQICTQKMNLLCTVFHLAHGM